MITVLYEDNHLLIVQKPAGVLSQKDKTGDDSIIEMGKSYIKKAYNKPGNVFLGLAHRLDRPVSGAIILCRTSKALTRMNDLISKREVKKVYNAIVSGRLPKKHDRVISYLKKNSSINKVVVRDETFQDAKQAILSYCVIKSNSNKSLLEIELETGRPHQIRAQLSHLSCPIVGDLKYGYPKPLSDKSIALHSQRLEFIHPVAKTPVSVTAPWPNKPWWNAFK